jgi:Immunity protein 49
VSSAYLADYIDNAEAGLEILIPAATRGELDGKGIHKLCDRFRQRGACTFLLTGDAEPFFVNEMQSAGAYLAWLRGADEAEKGTSQARPFYDAAGCGFWECARSIALVSRTTWNQAREYEDDFLFMRFLMKHFFLGAGEGECRALVARHEKAAEGADEAHRNVCLAFLDRDASLFDRSLRELLQARADRVEAMVEREAIPEESWSWLRYFSVEGFALLKLADRAGLPVGKDYLHVSDSLREGPSFAFDPDAWRQLRYTRG